MVKRTTIILSLLLLLLIAIYPLPVVHAEDISLPSFDESEYEEYLRYLENHPKSREYVNYEQMSFLGRFYGFHDSSSESKYLLYAYKFVDDYAQSVEVTVQHAQWEEELPGSERELSSDGMKDLRSHPDGTSGHIFVNSCKYYYDRDGKISYIRWESNGVYFQMRLSIVHGSSNGVSDRTFIDRLLSMDTAQDATQKLLEIVESRSYVMMTVIIACIGGCISGCVYGIRRYRKKKIAGNSAMPENTQEQ